jgi:hypothetical protein
MSRKEVFRFGEFPLDTAERQLKRGFETLRLGILSVAIAAWSSSCAGCGCRSQPELN